MAYLSTDPYAGDDQTEPPSGSPTFNRVAQGGSLPPGTATVQGGFMGASPTVPVNTIGSGGVTVGGAATGATPTAPAAPIEAGGPALSPNAGPGEIRAFIQQYAQAHNISPQQVPQVTRQIVDALKAKGFNVDYEMPDEYGRSAGIVFNGQHYKIIDGSGNWMFDTYERAEGSPWMSGGGGGYGNMFGNSGMGGPFNPPDWNSLKDYPGYQFAVDQGIRGIQNSAAAKGTLLTGGTMKDIVQFAGNSAALPAYQNYFSQALQTHNTNFGNLFDMAQLGKPT